MIIYAQSPIHGSGAFAAQDIRRGVFLTYYAGERIGEQEAARRIAATAKDGFTMIYRFSPTVYIDGSVGGNGGPLFNHSCQPNCIMVKEQDQLALYTKTFVPAGSELTYDYGMVLPASAPVGAQRLYACRCGSPKCMGTMLADQGK